jgi:hypothetical protein
VLLVFFFSSFSAKMFAASCGSGGGGNGIAKPCELQCGIFGEQKFGIFKDILKYRGAIQHPPMDSIALEFFHFRAVKKGSEKWLQKPHLQIMFRY